MSSPQVERKRKIAACSVPNWTNISSHKALLHRDFRKTVRAWCGNRYSIDGKETEMAEILLCKHPYSLDSLNNIHDMYSLRLKHKPRTGPPVLLPYHPYLHSTRPSITDENILVILDHHLPKKDITDMAFEFGEENAVAITEIAAAFRTYGAGTTGAATSIYSERIQNLGVAVKRYQDTLLEYRNIVKSNPAVSSASK
jgi:hypothetical protein